MNFEVGLLVCRDCYFRLEQLYGALIGKDFDIIMQTLPEF